MPTGSAPIWRCGDGGPTLITMKIAEIRCHRLTAPLHTPFVTALRRTEHLETTVVEVVADDGTPRVRRGAAGLAGDG